MTAPRVHPRSTTPMLPTKALGIRDLISTKLVPANERKAGTLLPFAVTTTEDGRDKTLTQDKNSTGKLI